MPKYYSNIENTLEYKFKSLFLDNQLLNKNDPIEIILPGVLQTDQMRMDNLIQETDMSIQQSTMLRDLLDSS